MSDSEYRVVDDYVTSESESEDEIWSSLKSSETEAGLRVDYRCNLEAEKVVQASTSSDISKKRYFNNFRDRLNTSLKNTKTNSFNV
ncbi:hypothetical protein BpHYR1_044387 [Brachionus plicatilis]|uniref:Uncharacterized protein n=1 Tax=Brachionus plicatilis TaxID=10195 RepID=A0A3M7SVX6_BRAPC|nr:hypothetical protein BpHYR1_044387 [Brachionus plicatilis]